jgi:hypothetical protein
MLDESLLDDPDALARADTHGLLRSVAEAGARVRTASRFAEEAAGISELRPEGHPRSVVVAGRGPEAAAIADLLAALNEGACLVHTLHPTGPTRHELTWTLPGWVGPTDLLILLTPNGQEAGLVTLVERAYRRGCTAVAVAPAHSPLTEALEQARGIAMPFAGPPSRTEPFTGQDPGAFWAMLTPVLAIADRIGICPASPGEIQAVADRLDEVAARCGPAIATYTNSAKTLAAELADTLPLLWSEGPAAATVARRFAAALAAWAGRPALAAQLPEALTAHEALLAGSLAGEAPEDFFRDRVEEESEPLRLRVVLLQDAVGRTRGSRTGRAASAAPAARELALAHDTPVSELRSADGGTGSALETVAELLAVTDFAAVYLAVASTERT